MFSPCSKEFSERPNSLQKVTQSLLTWECFPLSFEYLKAEGHQIIFYGILNNLTLMLNCKE